MCEIRGLDRLAHGRDMASSMLLRLSSRAARSPFALASALSASLTSSFMLASFAFNSVAVSIPLYLRLFMMQTWLVSEDADVH